MLPLLLYTFLQTLSLSQGFNITDVLPTENVKKPEDHSAVSSMLQYDISTGSDSRDVAVLQCTATKFCNTKQCPTVGLSMISLSQGCSGVLRARLTNITVDVSLNLLDAQEQTDLANKTCENLGCGRKHIMNATIRSGVCLADCILKESKLHRCTTAAEDDCTNATQVVCEHQAVRLVEGQDGCAGRVELLYNGQWGTVCDDDFDSWSGHVVCAQLGCGSMKRLGFFGAGTGPIHISKMKCNGTERNLWECGVNGNTPRDYCGHKEDIGVVCSESTEPMTTTTNTTYLPFMTWATESSAVVSLKRSSGVSPAVIGCIILAVALLLFILSNAAVCLHFRRQACEIQQHESHYQPDTVYRFSSARGVYNSQITTDPPAHQYECLISRPSSQYNHRFDRRADPSSHSSTSESDYEHHTSGQAHSYQNPPVNMNDSSSTSSGEGYKNTNINMDTIHKSGDEIPSRLEKSPLTPLAFGADAFAAIHSQAVDLNDSSSTSSGEFYTNAKADMDDKSNEEALLQEESSLTPVTPITDAHNNQLSPAENVNDSQSTSSGEVYQNTEVDNNLQSADEGSPSLPVPSLQTPQAVQTTEKVVYSGIRKIKVPNDSDSTSSEECYQNTEPLQSGKESPSPSETSLQTPLNHHSTQMTGSTVDYDDHHTTRNLSQDTDNSSTSSENSYVNVPPKNESDEGCSPAREQDARFSSDSDYDEPENW